MPDLLLMPPGRQVDDHPPTDFRSDSELAALARDDPQAFALLYTRYVDAVYRYCYRRLGNREGAEDATSLVFMKALTGLAEYRDGSFRGWLFTIAHHVVCDRHRANRPAQSLDAAGELFDTAPSPEDVALAAEDRLSVESLLGRLSEHQRQVVELRLAGLTGTEIAQALGRSSANIHVTQFRAVARLRTLLGLAATSTEVSHDV